MTKAAVIHQFWSSFGIPAYEENAVPSGSDAPDYPYITYTFASDSLGADLSMLASVWYRSTSWVAANAKAEEISKKITRGGIVLPCDGGAVWLRRGSPFSQSVGDEADDMMRRKYINITAEYLVAD